MTLRPDPFTAMCAAVSAWANELDLETAMENAAVADIMGSLWHWQALKPDCREGIREAHAITRAAGGCLVCRGSTGSTTDVLAAIDEVLRA